ncbi:hypothetical protein [Methanobrevibacter sp.]|uniref:hypothetical protein n=1 Tax=Methanobrevibacter sp. TaxID=66852 RepID=UPI00386F5FE5
MSRDSILKFIASDGQNGSIYTRSLVVLICILPPILGMLWIYFNTYDAFCLKFILIVISIFLVPSFFFIFQDTIDKKIKRISHIRNGYSYEYASILISSLIPSMIIVLLVICSHYNCLILGIISSSVFILPLFSLLRKNLYCDNNCMEDNEILFGYPPIYSLIGLTIALFGIFNIFQFYSDFNYFIICLIVILLFQLVMVNPDIVNKVLPFELRRKKGFLIFISCFIALYLIVIFLMCGSLEFLTLQIDLTPWGILRKIIIYGLSIILAIQFYKLSKKMNKKG